jgi:hypothetical protein
MSLRLSTRAFLLLGSQENELRQGRVTDWFFKHIHSSEAAPRQERQAPIRAAAFKIMKQFEVSSILRARLR